MRRRKGLERLELGMMGIMTLGAQQVLLVSVPVPGAFPVNAGLPVPQFFDVALTTESIGFGKRDDPPGNEAKSVAVIGIVAIETPALSFAVVEDDIGVLIDQLALVQIGFHIGMAGGTGENPLGQYGWGNRKGSSGRRLFNAHPIHAIEVFRLRRLRRRGPMAQKQSHDPQGDGGEKGVPFHHGVLSSWASSRILS
jgi:hypothetical protein